MPEPVTPNIGLIVPNTGDLPGAWGTSAVNPNMTALDGLFGGVAALSLGAATTITLSASTAVVTPSAGPFQSNNAVISLAGTLSGNAVIKVSVPGRYIIDNRCLAGTNYVQLAPSSGGGNSCGVPAGRKTTFFFDGTNVDFVDLTPEIGALEFITIGTSGPLPAWIAACTVPPLINVSDSGPFIGTGSFNAVTYPSLFNLLGTTSLPAINQYASVIFTPAMACFIRAA